MVLVSFLPPVPAKLVKKISAGKFVEMHELLPDKASLHQALEVIAPSIGRLSSIAIVDNILT